MMQENNMKIEYPTTEEINISIAKAIETAYPRKKRLMPYIRELYRQIGMEYLLHGLPYMVIILMALYFIAFTWNNEWTQYSTNRDVCLLLVIFSPFAFQMLLGLSIVSEKEQQAYELEMTCKYTMFHLLALRMLLMSIISVIFNTVTCIGLFYSEGFEFVMRLILLSITSLGVYTLCYLKLLIRSVNVKGQILLYVLWTMGNLTLRTVVPNLYEFAAMELPLLVHVAVWAGLILVAGKNLSNFLYRAQRYIYAK